MNELTGAQIMGTEAPSMLEDNEYPNVRTSAGTSASEFNDLLCLRVRKVGETIRPNDVVLFDGIFMPVGFATHCGHYYAGQIVTTSMSGKVICKQT